MNTVLKYHIRARSVGYGACIDQYTVTGHLITSMSIGTYATEEGAIRAAQRYIREAQGHA